MKKFLSVFLFCLSFYKILAFSCTETFEERDSDYIYFDYYDDSHSKEDTKESATITCVNLTSVVNLPLPLSYTHIPQNYEQFLNISQSSIHMIPKKAFAMFHSISKLYLNGININVIEPGTFDNLTKLRELYLSNNFLRLTSNVFNPLPALEVLDLSDNALFYVNKMAFKGIEKLRVLNLKHNFLTILNKDMFTDLRFLESLLLSWNYFSDFPLQIFQNNNEWAMDNLTIVELARNNFVKFDTNLSNTSIKFFNLSLNRLKTFDFSYIPSDIFQIDLSKNHIAMLNNVEILQSTDLYLDYNKICNLTGYFGKISRLHLSNNRIETLENTLFNKSENIVFIQLSHNRISQIDKDVFSDLNYLEELYLDNNRITKITPGTFRNLEKVKILDLSHNQLEQLQFGTFETLSSLHNLDLANNKLSNLDQQVFYSLNSLAILHLNNNNVSRIDAESLVIHCGNLQRVSLDQNPWACKNLVHINQVLKIRQITMEMGSSFNDENFRGIKCLNSKEVDPQSGVNNSKVAMKHLYQEFQKAVNRGVQDSKINSFFNDDFKKSKFFHYFNKSQNENGSSTDSSGENTNVLIAANIVQIILSILLLVTICLIVYKLKKAKFSLSQSQTQLYYKP